MLNRRIDRAAGAVHLRGESRGVQGDPRLVDLLLELGHGQVLALHFGKCLLHRGLVRQPTELLEMAVMELALLPRLEDLRRQGQDRDPGPDVGRPDSGLLGQLHDRLLSVPTRVGLERFGLLEFRQVLALQVFDKHEIIGIIVREFPDQGGDRRQAGNTGGLEPALADDDFIRSLLALYRPDHDRLDNSLLFNGLDELVKLGTRESFSRIH